MGAEMALRSVRERVFQTLTYEGVGLLLISPLIAAFHGMENSESLALLVAVSLICLAWAPVHNTVFDIVDLRRSGRVASDRPQCWRMVHAASLEVTSTLVTIPAIMYLTGYGFREALLFDITLTFAYTAYAYLFHLTYDRLRPVRQEEDGAAAHFP
jgi:uncharacterized membrane protein